MPIRSSPATARDLRQACPYFDLICGLDGMQSLLAVTNWAAQDDKAIADEPVHECRVPGPWTWSRV